MLDPSKPVQTTDGRSARIVCTDAYVQISPTCSEKEILALVPGVDGTEDIRRFSQSGRAKYVYGYDLINIPQHIKKEGWVNIYGTVVLPNTSSFLPGVGRLHPTKASADHNAFEGRIACVKVVIECEEGEGL